MYADLYCLNDTMIEIKHNNNNHDNLISMHETLHEAEAVFNSIAVKCNVTTFDTLTMFIQLTQYNKYTKMLTFDNYY